MSSPGSRLRIVPLGGLGEVGMNCFAIEHGDDVVVVDCGTKFPNDELGVDVIHPDFEWLRANASRVRGAVLTHGHEDHIGAVPYLLNDLPVPLYGPRHALALVARRLERHGFEEKEWTKRVVLAGQRFFVGSIEFEPIRVSHSIVDATALCIRTPAGTVLHTGDFKFDPAPSDGEVTDEARLLEIGAEGVDLLLSDSTNVDELGEAGSEGDVREHLLDSVRSAERRVFVALFASNVQRLLSLGEVARQTGRRIAALGTSLVRHVEVARELGFLPWPRDFLLPPEAIRTFPARELLLLTSGTQAEPGSALWRLSRGEHRFAEVQRGDRVVFSSRIIPGRDRQVVSMVCDLLRMGAEVEWGRRSGAHTSGHACRDEQAKMIQLVAPRAFVPVHGTLHHLMKHAALARELGVDQVDVVENGQTIVLEQGSIHRGERVPSGEVHVGIGGGVLGIETLQERRELGRGGHVTIAVACDARARLVGAPVVRAQGVPLLAPGSRARAELETLIEKEWSSVRRRSFELLEEQIGKLVRGFLDARHGIWPVITVVASELDERGRGKQ